MKATRRRRSVHLRWLFAGVTLAFGSYAWTLQLLATSKGPARPRQRQQLLDLDLERRTSWHYVRSISDTSRRLSFLHVPKAAGTTIEEVGGLQADQGTWGSCGFLHFPKRRGGACQYPSDQFVWPTLIGWWHLPAQLFPILGVDPYKDSETFVVVRAPRDRLLSEFYYICRLKKGKYNDGSRCDETKMYNVAYMNEWIQIRLLEQLESKTAESYLKENGHFTPQSEFVHSQGIRMADYVLRMDETLPNEFGALMQAYELPAHLSQHRNAAKASSRDLTVTDFDAKTNELIEKIYGQDLELFR